MILGESVAWPKYAIDTARKAMESRGENIMVEPATRIALEVPQSSRSSGAKASMKRSTKTSRIGMSDTGWHIGNSRRHGSRMTRNSLEILNRPYIQLCTLLLYSNKLIFLVLQIAILRSIRFASVRKAFVTHYILARKMTRD